MSVPHWEPPSAFDEYRIVRPLGRGAMGQVYLAHDALLDRQVAIKFIGAREAGEGARERFFTEARAVARLSHPNVVAIHRVGEVGRRPYLVSEYVSGTSLDRVPKPLPWERILGIAIGLARGLASAHRHGVLHRDIKPANVVIGDDDQAKLLDFGLAKLLDAAAVERGDIFTDIPPTMAAQAGLAATLSIAGRAAPPERDEPASGWQMPEASGSPPLTAIGAIVGTPLYLAPELWRGEPATRRSDVYALGILLYELACGRAPHAGHSLDELCSRAQQQDVPPIAALAPEVPAPLAEVIDACVSRNPERRPESGDGICTRLESLSLAHPSEPSAEAIAQPPFRRLAAFTEADRGRLYGRDRELAILAEQVLYRRTVVFTAPSGTGKTSLLRAGLQPRLEQMGIRVVYASSRSEPVATIIASLAAGCAGLAQAVEAWSAGGGPRLVIILDQIETLLADRPAVGAELLTELMALGRGDDVLRVSIVIAVREDFLARVLSHIQGPDDAAGPIVRLGPLDLAGARAAIVRPLAERRLRIEPALLETLLADLTTASTELGRELGWGSEAGVYPPHLQLACSVLYEALAPDEKTLRIEHYRRMGGLDEIVAEHLDRVLETELAPDSAAIARDLLLALVTAAHTRAVRTEAELLEAVTRPGGAERVPEVLEVLRARGLLVRTSRSAGEAVWELIHDSLVVRVQSWIDRHDLARRRAIELVRYHLRRSSLAAPSLLSRAELREVDLHADALVELDAQWACRSVASQVDGTSSWTPGTLVARSRWILRRRVLVAVAAAVTLIVVVGAAIVDRRAMADAREREQSLRDRDLGRFVLELAPFDWDASGLIPVDVLAAELPRLDWTLHEPDPDDPESPGPQLVGSRLIRGPPSPSENGHVLAQEVEAPGGAAFLRITGRGRRGEQCPTSVVPLRSLPGYARRDGATSRLLVRVPTCEATRAGMIQIPAGPFVSGGLGEPPAALDPRDLPEERTIDLDGYWIDRTEVTNGAYRLLAGENTGIPMPAYPESDDLAEAGGDRFPAADMTWNEARAFCRFLGKELPTSQQWEKALRGGVRLAGGPNPYPRRNLPWGVAAGVAPTNLRDTPPQGPAPVASMPGDVSPDGVLDLGGNMMEWTASIAEPPTHASLPPGPAPPDRIHFRFARGCNWDNCDSKNLINFLAIPNPRSLRFHSFALGFRCALAAGAH